MECSSGGWNVAWNVDPNVDVDVVRTKNALFAIPSRGSICVPSPEHRVDIVTLRLTTYLPQRVR